LKKIKDTRNFKKEVASDVK